MGVGVCGVMCLSVGVGVCGVWWCGVCGCVGVCVGCVWCVGVHVRTWAWDEMPSLHYFKSMYSNGLLIEVSFRPLELAKNSKSAVKHSI